MVPITGEETMRISDSGRIKKYSNLQEQVKAALHASASKIDGVEVIARLLGDTVMDSESNHKEVLTTYDLASAINVLSFVSKKAASDIMSVAVALEDDTVRNSLMDHKPSVEIEEFTHRELTPVEENLEDKEFFDSYFKQSNK